MDKRRPIDDLLGEFRAHMKDKCNDRSKEPERKPDRVRRIFAAIGAGETFETLSADKVNAALKKMDALGGERLGKRLSQRTRREYLFSIKAFCEWMVDEGKASSNPLRKLKAPAAKGAPVRNRRPVNVDDFSKLLEYLLTAPLRYRGQSLPWTPKDRLMIYWTAVMTGFRANELKSLTRAHIDFDCTPARVTVEGWVAKNGQKATIPISDDIARALRGYSAHLHPNAPLLRIPTLGELAAALRRDLKAAGLRHKFDDGTMVDFHALRSTAICWWLTQNKLHLLDVQYRARLKTLSLVQEYVDNYAPDHAELVRNTPRVIDPGLPFKQVS